MSEKLVGARLATIAIDDDHTIMVHVPLDHVLPTLAENRHVVRPAEGIDLAAFSHPGQQLFRRPEDESLAMDTSVHTMCSITKREFDACAVDL
mmetsp:Transcript_9208/g.24166  ORF Transcript_9208/g.24166 Transcript_9208/m.24166 type:complete len:93 (+) Transcript_9208:204-482(+)